MKLIGLYSPQPQSGKSTAAGIFEDHVYIRSSFATIIKNMSKVLLNNFVSPSTVNAMLYGNAKNDIIPGINVTTRHLLQTLGTEWGRDCIDKNVWVEAWRGGVLNTMADGFNVIVDDLRFSNEMDAILHLGGECWWIDRPDVTDDNGACLHSSEGTLNSRYGEFTRHITNYGTLDEFKAEIIKAINFMVAENEE